MSGQDGVQTIVRPAAALGEEDWQELWELSRRFFDAERWYAESELFRRELIATFRVKDQLVGMACIDILPVTFRGRSIAVILTTHVLLRKEWRGRNLLQRLGWRTWLRTKLRYPFRPIYWFFDTYGYKSYLLLPRNFVTYWPRRDAPTPESEHALIDQLAKQNYGGRWRPDLGLVLRSGRKRLLETTAPLTQAELADADIRFFAEANPGHAEGDMLVCLCPLTLQNWISVGRKALERRRRRRTH